MDSEAADSAEEDLAVDFNNKKHFEVISMGLFSKKVRYDEHDPEINCPRCGVSMIKKTRHSVTIDKCKKCDGIWLDGGEIEKILIKINEEQKKFKKKKS